MSTKVRWGILGTGNIARSFATGFKALPDAEIVAVGSRSQATAEKYADMFGIAKRYASYEALASDPDVEVIYVSTPHPFHHENSLLCLEHGKAVLCEKPFAMSAREAREVIDAARERKLFLMEAMWSRFFPVMVKVRELLAQGTIGDVRMLSADFGFRAELDPSSRLFDLRLGGGALLDVGVYPVALASMIFGPPADIQTKAHLGKTGVDEQAAMIFSYADGALALLSTAITLDTPQVATIIGTEGSIQLHSPWWKPEALLTLTRAGAEPERIDVPYEGNGYNYEAAAVGRALRAGRTEEETMPLDETLQIVKTMDSIRSMWGLRYPTD